MFTAIETLPQEELEARWSRCRALLRRFCPTSGGLLVFSRLNIYYLAGTYGSGVFWLPLDGQPVLAVRKGVERAHLESPGLPVGLYRSYSELPKLCADLGSPLTREFAVEQSGLAWNYGLNFAARLSPQYAFKPGDQVLDHLRAVKTPWELAKLRLAGTRHREALEKLVPDRLRPGMSERQISHLIWKIFFRLGHSGLTRLAGPGEETFLGHVSAGVNTMYPSYFNGPLGVKGEHPVAAYMGYAGTLWQPGEFLAADVGFALEGYNTDKTQMYFAGSPAKAPDTQRRAMECTLRIQEEARQALKPGSLPSELYAHSLKLAAEAGFAQGYMGMGGNQVPFLGHGIGLNVDEWPALAHGFNEPLEADMVIALEPKITVPNLGMVGVENTFVVTPQGGEPLTCGPDGGGVIYWDC